MQSVLYISHGSRDADAILEAKAFLQSVIKQTEILLSEICFLELASPSMEEGIETLVRQGASKIAVIPVLLLSGGHYWHDIPAAIKRAQEKYPNITFTYGKPIGVQERIVRVLAERVNETNAHQDANVLLVGRGSRSEQTKVAVEEIAAALQAEIGRPVNISYLAVLKPSFEDAVQSLSEQGAPLIVVPYLWFTGVLMKYIQRKSADLSGEHQQIIVCQQLGGHKEMIEALKERVYEAITSREVVR